MLAVPANGSPIDRILEDLVAVLPVFYRKILKMDLGGVAGDLTQLHLGLMAKLSERSMTALELARVSKLPKPQVTHLVCQLVQAGTVARSTYPAD